MAVAHAGTQRVLDRRMEAPRVLRRDADTGLRKIVDLLPVGLEADENIRVRLDLGLGFGAIVADDLLPDTALDLQAVQPQEGSGYVVPREGGAQQVRGIRGQDLGQCLEVLGADPVD